MSLSIAENRLRLLKPANTGKIIEISELAAIFKPAFQMIFINSPSKWYYYFTCFFRMGL